jgi:hypothetical protein
MNRDAAVAEIQLIMGFRSDLATSAVTALQNAQSHFEQNWPDPTNLPWFLITERATSSTVAEEERLARPSDWLGDVEEDGLWLTNSDDEEVLLEKGDIDDLRAIYGNDDSTFPVAYGFDGLYYRLFPKPDASYSAKMLYYAQDDTLSSGSTENQWLKHAPNVLIGYAGVTLCSGAKDGRMQIFQQRMIDAIAAVNAKSLAIPYVGKQSTMGEDQ